MGVATREAEAEARDRVWRGDGVDYEELHDVLAAEPGTPEDSVRQAAVRLLRERGVLAAEQDGNFEVRRRGLFAGVYESRPWYFTSPADAAAYARSADSDGLEVFRLERVS